MANSSELTPEEYNEQVYYCMSCHSLAVVTDSQATDDEWDGSYCEKCYSTHIGTCKFGEWLEEEEKRDAKRREIEWNR